jgi:RNA polymerase sigma factor (sigma-70 family)
MLGPVTPPENAASDSEPRDPRQFATTHWSLVLAAKERDSPAAAGALEELCSTYWPPLYAFIRREGYAEAEAQDLTQGFFAQLLQKHHLGHLRHREGRFRSFLLTILKHFLADERDKERAQKRGGGRTFISLDAFTREDRQKFEPADSLTPEQIFERRWAQTVLERAAGRLRDEYAAAGDAELYEQLKDLDPGKRGDLTYAELGVPLRMSESAIKSAIHRLRRRHRQILREEIAHTVTQPDEIDDEVRHLIAVLNR